MQLQPELLHIHSLDLSFGMPKLQLSTDSNPASTTETVSWLSFRAGISPWAYRAKGRCEHFTVDPAIYDEPPSSGPFVLPFQPSPVHGDVLDFGGARGSTTYVVAVDDPWLKNSYMTIKNLTEYGYWVSPFFSDAPLDYYSDSSGVVRLIWPPLGLACSDRKVVRLAETVPSNDQCSKAKVYSPLKECIEGMPETLPVEPLLPEGYTVSRTLTHLSKRKSWLLSFSKSMVWYSLGVCLEGFTPQITDVIAEFLVQLGPNEFDYPSLAQSSGFRGVLSVEEYEQQALQQFHCVQTAPAC